MAHEGEPIAPTELLRKAADGLERLGRYGEEAEETRHALVAAGVGRGDRGGRNAGHREKRERDSGRGQPHTLPLNDCARHGEGQGHNTSDCIVIRRELDRHNGDFHPYSDRFPGGHGHERNRHHPSGGCGRGRGEGFRQLRPPNLPPNLPPDYRLICRVDNLPTDRCTTSRQAIPTAT